MFRTKYSSSIALTLSFAFLFALTPTVQSEPPNECEYKPLKVNVIHGVILAFGTMDPIANAKIVLRKGSDKGEVIAETITDSRGRFAFPKLPSGKYFLTAEARDFHAFGAEVQVSRFRQARTGIVLALSVNTIGMSCFESAKTRTLPPQ